MSKNQSGNVRVVVRIRPENGHEKEGNFKIVVKEIDDFMLVFDPKENTETVQFGRGLAFKSRKRTILDRRVKDLKFAFDRVFNETSTNEEVFEFATKSMVDSVLQGFNCSVFAYGATSAGKTHTMLGSHSHPGVIFQTMMELYKRIFEMSEEYVCDISVSYLEIYNETVRDLLLPTGPLALREVPQKGVCVNGLSLHKPRNAEELLGMLEFGNQNRTQHPTDANKQSSRSHAVFQVFCRQQPKAAGLSATVKCSKMSLIDLAGSERATVTTNRGARFREGANINRSLLALGNCINALAENKTKVYVPYRDSKLTRLLKDSLGGNCKTLMIAAVSPSSMSYEDTYNTLKYASRAKSIKSQLSTNVMSVNFHVSQYVKIVEELKKQNEELKAKVARYENGEATPIRLFTQEKRQREQLERCEQELISVYKDRCLIRKQLIDCEAAQKEVSIKLYRKERNLIERMEALCPGTSLADEARTKFLQFEASSKKKTTDLEVKKLALIKRLDENTQRLESVNNEGETLVADSLAVNKDRYTLFRECRSHELEKVTGRAQAEHYRRYAMLVEKASQSTERLVTDLLELLKKQHAALQDSGSCTSELSTEYDTLLGKIAGNRKLAWADETMNESMNVSSVLNFETCTPRKPSARVLDVLREGTPRNATPRGICKDTLTPLRLLCNPKERRGTIILDRTENCVESLLETDPSSCHSLMEAKPPPPSSEETMETTDVHDVVNRTFTVDADEIQPPSQEKANQVIPVVQPVVNAQAGSYTRNSPHVPSTPSITITPTAKHSQPSSNKLTPLHLHSAVSPSRKSPKNAVKSTLNHLNSPEQQRRTLAKNFPLSKGSSMNNLVSIAPSVRSPVSTTPAKHELPKPCLDRTPGEMNRQIPPPGSSSHLLQQRSQFSRENQFRSSFKLTNKNEQSAHMPRYASNTVSTQKKRKGTGFPSHTLSKHRRASKENRLSHGRSTSQPDLHLLTKKDFGVRRFGFKKSVSQYNVNKI